MPEQAGRNSPRDFAFQSTDQALVHHQLGGAEVANTSSFSPHNHDRYDARRDTNASNASSAQTHPAGQDAILGYPEYGVQQNQLHASAQRPLPRYGFNPEASLDWNWDSSIDFADFENHYEPQGELAHEHQNRAEPANTFSIPLPIINTDHVYQSPSSVQAPIPTSALKPLSAPARPPQRPAVKTGMKRKAESEPNSAVSQDSQPNPPKRTEKPRSTSTTSVASPTGASGNRTRQSSTGQTATAEAADPSSNGANPEPQRHKETGKETSKGTGPQGRVIDYSKPRKIVGSSPGFDMLPAGKVFPIQIGSELFRLSGASISSDAPSYFSHFFGEQLHNPTSRAGDLKTLYIDRDPDTFRDIALHLQGYYVRPRDGEHFVRLFADAQFYSLPRLTKNLFSTDIFIRIGQTPFQIPRDLFSSPGDSPNFFTLGFAQFFTTPNEVFPGLDRNALLRPPSISPPAVPNRSGETFAELIKLLQGYDIEIRNAEHRGQLLRDARYFHLKGLEQRLIPSDVSFNLRRNQSEILVKLEDIRQSGISFTPDTLARSYSSGTGSTSVSALGVSPGPDASKPASPALSVSGNQSRAGTVSYARPYTDDHANTNILILEVSSSETTTLHLPSYPPTSFSTTAGFAIDLRATFHASTLARITSLFSVVASKMGLPATQPLGLMMLASGGGVAAQPVSPANSGVSERRVRVRISTDCYMEIDNSPVELDVDPESGRLGVRRVKSPSTTGNAQTFEEHLGDGASPQATTDWLWGGAMADRASTKSGEELEAQWIVQRAHWRLRVEPVDGDGGKMQVVLCGVRIEAHSVEKSRNKSRGFLSG